MDHSVECFPSQGVVCERSRHYCNLQNWQTVNNNDNLHLNFFLVQMDLLILDSKYILLSTAAVSGLLSNKQGRDKDRILN